VRRDGGSRSIRYYPTEEFRHAVAMRYISLPQRERERKGYCDEILRDYEPNKSFYLPQKIRDELHARCAPGSFNCKDPALAQQMRRFMTDLSHHSALLEGVRVNYIDTISLLEDNIQSKRLSDEEAMIIRNHYNAAKIISAATGYPPDPRDFRVCGHDIFQIHAILSDGLLKDRRLQGRLRHEPVEVQYSQYVPISIPQQIEYYFGMLVDKARAISDPYEQAFFLAVHIPYLQPFADCNKRTSRVVCNIPLLNNGVLPVSWREVSVKDYNDAIMCIYEKQSLYGFAMLFSEACARSFERFNIEAKQRRPSRLEVTYAKEISDVIFRRVVDGDYHYRPSIPEEDWAYLRGYIDSVLQDAIDNDMVLAPYRISYEDWKSWRESQIGIPDERMTG